MLPQKLVHLTNSETMISFWRNQINGSSQEKQEK